MQGLAFEIYISKHFHQRGIPVLVSPIILRRRNLGQIDLVHIVDDIVIVYEIKSSTIGKEQLYKGKQITRLRHSSLWLSQLFKKHAQLKIIAKR